MDLRYYAEKLWYRVIYLIVVIVYLVCLNNLNHELLMQNFEPSFMLLAYDNYVALKYFVIALILFAIGCFLIYKEFKKMMKENDKFEEIIISFATIVVVLILLVLLIVFIDNPILRTVMCAIAAVLFFTQALAK